MKKSKLLLSILVGGIAIGYAYNVDQLQALEIPLRKQPYNFSTANFNLAYFSTFAPIAIFDIPLGFMMGKYSLKITIPIFLLIGFLSQMLIGLVFQFLPPFYIGFILILRSIFGLSSQALITGQTLVLTQYAKQDYQMLFAIIICVPWIFNSVNSITTTHLYDATQNLPLCWYIGGCICFLALASGVLLSFYMKRLDKKVNLIEQDDIKIDSIDSKDNNNQKTTQQKQQNLIQNESESLKQNLLSNSNESENMLNKSQKYSSFLASQITNSTDQQQEQQDFSLANVKQLSSTFWILMLSVFISQASLAPFLDNFNQLLVKRFGISYTDAGKLILIPWSFYIVCSISLGKVLSKRPKWRRSSFVLSTILYTSLMFGLYLMPNSEEATPFTYFYIIIFLMSLSFSFAVDYTGLTTAVVYVVRKKAQGAAWGVCGCAISGAQCILPLVNIWIIGIDDGNLGEAYKTLTFFTFILALIPLSLALFMRFNRKFDIMDITYSQKQRMQKRQRKLQIQRKRIQKIQSLITNQ